VIACLALKKLFAAPEEPITFQERSPRAAALKTALHKQLDPFDFKVGLFTLWFDYKRRARNLLVLRKLTQAQRQRNDCRSALQLNVHGPRRRFGT
jgi:hypothetical protein